ncbi:hypothetical protein SPRG_00048 [Saprolegnia parasitica CBS 223.65]|uniref:FAD-binding PCMH-type domain-containing protein n=1 Tax=Saprolegnia parasitica (strain CBS 223.65) TaxID=695850 RepID=A0A067D885_SAPPC|nr:hypothetical protein SPRG_00048 [Saprolegnia parasitica CBS 223.65]KDO35202.1 hypothetical protein SPRG_00048 [Saprolegnia parasitica CBS 223.65]|eukprot:XP_012193554.1 hypothetical protein SPRG_00048 [Saprolegnia parasitica CBS 223.65]
MGGTCTKVSAASLGGRDAGRTRSTAANIEKYGRFLQEIPVDGTVVLASMAEEYQRLRSSAYAFVDCGYPFAIFRPLHARDIALFLQAVGHLKLHIAVAGGKHSALCLPDNSVVIDLHYLSDIRVNAEDKYIDIGGGARMGAADAELRGSGLAFVGGTHPDTGVGGFAQTGGWGWLSRQHGLAVDHWLEADVVLANGDIVTASDSNEHCHLMRALRGGAGNFGVVTRFRFALHRIDRCHYSTPLRFCPTIVSAKKTAKAFRDRMDAAPTYASGMLVLHCGKPLVSQVITAIGDANVVTDTTWIDDMRHLDGGQWATLRASRRDGGYHLGLQSVLEPLTQRGHTMTTSYFVKDLSDAVLSVLVRYTRVQYPGARSVIAAAAWGGQIPLEGRPHAMSHRENGWWILVHAVLPDMSWYQVTKHKQWVLAVKVALQDVDNSAMQAPHVSFDTITRNATAKTRAFDDVTHLFLRQVKTEYDRKNVFHMNHNIRPLV